MNTQSALRRLTTEKSTARIQQRRGYTKNVVIFRTLGILMLIISTLELTWGALLHFLISAEGIGAWWAALNPLACAFFALRVTSTKKLAGLLLNAVLGIFTTMVGCIIEFNDRKRLINIKACYDSFSNDYSYFYNNTDNLALQGTINKTCTEAFNYQTSSPEYDCWCIDSSSSSKCIKFDIGIRSDSCYQMFVPTPPQSKILTYSVLSGAFCIILLVLCLFITILGCSKAFKEEDNSNDPLRLLEVARQQQNPINDPNFDDVIKLQNNSTKI